MGNAQLDRPAELASLAAPQPDAIVSRVLAKSAGGSVTLFAFDAGQALSEHSAPFDALLHVLCGRMEVSIGGMEHPMTAGEILRLPANVPHAVRAPVAATILLVMLRDSPAGS